MPAEIERGEAPGRDDMGIENRPIIRYLSCGGSIKNALLSIGLRGVHVTLAFEADGPRSCTSSGPDDLWGIYHRSDGFDYEDCRCVVSKKFVGEESCFLVGSDHT